MTSLHRRVRPYLLLLFLMGCVPPGSQTVKLSHFEKDPLAYQGHEMTVQVMNGSEIRRVPVESIPSELLNRIPAEARETHVFVVNKATHRNAVLRCHSVFGASAGTSVYMPGMWDPSTGRMSGASSIDLPGEFGLQHGVKVAIDSRSVVDAEEALIAHVMDPRVPGDTYFCRRPGYENLLTREEELLHPGYSSLEGDFWLIVPKSRVRVLRDQGPGVSRDSTADASPSLERAYGEDPGWSCDEFEARAAESLGEGSSNGQRTAIVAYGRALKLSTDRALCLARQGNDEEALDLLERSIFGHSTMPGWSHERLFGACLAQAMIRTARGEVDEAVAALGRVLHMTPPGWSLPSDPATVLEPVPTALAGFLEARGSEVQLHWPAVREAVRSRLD